MTTTITALPTPPARNDPATFPARSDAFLGALATFRGETNIVAGEINAASASASASAAAAAAAAAAVISAGAAMWVSGTTYAQGNLVYSQLDSQTYRRKTNGAGTTDPSADATNWVSVTADLTTGPTLVGATITGGTAVAGGMVVSGGADVTGAMTVGGALTQATAAIGASNIDVSLANYYNATIVANTTFTVSNVPASGKVASFLLDLTNGGAFTVTWWAGMTWAEGSPPALTASGRDVLGFFTRDGGTTWTGFRMGAGFA